MGSTEPSGVTEAAAEVGETATDSGSDDTDSNDGEVVADVDVSRDGGSVYTAFVVGYLTPEDEPADAPFDRLVARDGGSTTG
jgi:hypothetical protein